MSELKKLYKVYPGGQVKEESVYNNDNVVKETYYSSDNKIKQIITYYDTGVRSSVTRFKNDEKVVQKFNLRGELDGFAAYEKYSKVNSHLRLSYTNGKLGRDSKIGWNYIEKSTANGIYCDVRVGGKLGEVLIEGKTSYKVNENGIVILPDNLKGKFQFVVEGERVIKKKLS